MPRIDFIVEAPDWNQSDRDFAESDGEMTNFRGGLVEGAAMERGLKKSGHTFIV